MNKPITIFFAIDENYAPLLKVAFNSMMKRADPKASYHIIVLHVLLSEKVKKEIRELVSKYPAFRVSFFDVRAKMEMLSKHVNVRDYYTLTTYYRLILPKAFPRIDKALYLDADIVLKADVSALFQINLGDLYLGAVADASVQEFPEFAKYTEKALGIPRREYFNAGVLIMNLKQLRKFRLEEKIIQLVSKISFKVAQDQDLLNVLCRGHVLHLSDHWNVMPLGEKKKTPYLIHYNLLFKPWKNSSVMYEDIFWEEAKDAGVYEELQKAKEEITEEMRQSQLEGLMNVKRLCVSETEKWRYYREGIEYMERNPKREEILQKIQQLEREGKFDQDVENDPPYIPLKPGDVDYLQKHWISKIMSRTANRYSYSYFMKKVNKGEIVIDGMDGFENLKHLSTGAVITANHFHPFDSIPLHIACKKCCPKRKLFKVIKEGNYSFPGKYGFFMRHANSLPLASNMIVLKEMMTATEELLRKGNLVLIYAEQSMWWNYRKPKPLKIGAFQFAVRAGVPVVPTFITMKDTEELDADGYPVQAYTLHILPPIYPDASLAPRQAAKKMKEANEKAWKDIYEKAYGIRLTYETEEAEVENRA